jgi:hypothetical protein
MKMKQSVPERRHIKCGRRGITQNPPGWWFGVGLTTPHSKKLIVTKVEKRKKLDGCIDDGESW